MNLHAVVSNQISAVNPNQKAAIQFSTGYTTLPNGQQVPQYAFAEFLGAAVADELIAIQVLSGVISVGDIISGGDLPSWLSVAYDLTGNGGSGVYRLDRPQATFPATTVVTKGTLVTAQVQQLTTRDLRQLDALNIQGSHRKIYVNGSVQAIVRVAQRGGDLIVTQDGRTWLTTQVLEQWVDWCAVSVALQDDT